MLGDGVGLRLHAQSRALVGLRSTFGTCGWTFQRCAQSLFGLGAEVGLHDLPWPAGQGLADRLGAADVGEHDDGGAAGRQGLPELLQVVILDPEVGQGGTATAGAGNRVSSVGWTTRATVARSSTETSSAIRSACTAFWR